jgi:predicted nucleic acid-binding Zn ribbon protein
VQDLSALVPRVLRDHGLEAGVEGWRAVGAWPDVVGARIARRSRAVGFRDGTLFVEVEGSAWLHELDILKRDLVRRLQQHLGSQSVRHLRLTMARGGNQR